VRRPGSGGAAGRPGARLLPGGGGPAAAGPVHRRVRTVTRVAAAWVAGGYRVDVDMASRHLVWDWNGTLLDDLPVVVAATNAALAGAGGGPVTVPEHRRHFRRPIADYYAQVLGRPVDEDEFARLDKVF